jgi:biotin synthase
VNIPDIERPLKTAAKALLEEKRDLSFDEALAVAELPDEALPSIVALSHQVLLDRCGPEVALESIISAKTGACPEDCSFCSQSAHYNSPIRVHPMLDTKTLLDAAKDSERLGASHFCIVVAARGPDDRLLRKVLDAVERIRSETSVEVACSLGILTRDQAFALAAAGVHTYNHNLETSRSFFPNICTTHTYDDRVRTCLYVKEAGMDLCSGGIIGMGESVRQRIEFAFELRALDPVEVPINFLDPRPGTPLASRPLVQPMEAVRTIALFRLIMPEVVLKYAGGREKTLRELQAYGLIAGINGLIVGNYLTTTGRPAKEDLAMLADLGRPPVSQSKLSERVRLEKQLRASSGAADSSCDGGGPVCEELTTTEAVVLIEPDKPVRFIPPGSAASARRLEAGGTDGFDSRARR